MATKLFLITLFLVVLKFSESIPTDTVLLKLNQDVDRLKIKIYNNLQDIGQRLGKINEYIQHEVNQAENNIVDHIATIEDYVEEAKKVAQQTGANIQLCFDRAAKQLNSTDWSKLTECRVDALTDIRDKITTLEEYLIDVQNIVSNCHIATADSDDDYNDDHDDDGNLSDAENLQVCVGHQVEQVANLTASLHQECLAGFNNAVKVSGACVEVVLPRLVLICDSIGRNFKSCVIDQMGLGKK